MEGYDAIVVWAVGGIAVGVLLMLPKIVKAIVGVIREKVAHEMLMRPKNPYIV